jgi:hypothetical protein
MCFRARAPEPLLVPPLLPLPSCVCVFAKRPRRGDPKSSEVKLELRILVELPTPIEPHSYGPPPTELEPRGRCHESFSPTASSPSYSLYSSPCPICAVFILSSMLPTLTMFFRLRLFQLLIGFEVVILRIPCPEFGEPASWSFSLGSGPF